MNTISFLLGERIRELRHERGMSQEQLALKAGINTTFLGHIERGTKKPTIDTITKIVSALDISYSQLFDFSDKPSGGESLDILSKIIYELKGCSSDEQESIYKIIKQIVYLKNKK